MILGIDKVVRLHEVEAGRFYLAQQYEEDPQLFLCVHTGVQVEGQPELAALCFDVGEEKSVELQALPYQGPLVALPDVLFRVDASSMKRTSSSDAVRKNMLLVSGDEVYVACASGRFGWSLVDFRSAAVVENRAPEYWVSFDRWRLVMIDGDEEIALTSFGEISI